MDESGKDREREVTSITYSLNQTVDKDGQVTDVPRGGLIVMRMKALNKYNAKLFDWMCDKSRVEKGKILFHDTTTGVIMKTIWFEDAYCVNYVEHWSDDTAGVDIAHWEEITISCRIISQEGITHVNGWNSIRGKQFREGDGKPEWDDDF